MTFCESPRNSNKPGENWTLPLVYIKFRIRFRAKLKQFSTDFRSQMKLRTIITRRTNVSVVSCAVNRTATQFTFASRPIAHYCTQFITQTGAPHSSTGRSKKKIMVIIILAVFECVKTILLPYDTTQSSKCMPN